MFHATKNNNKEYGECCMLNKIKLLFYIAVITIILACNIYAWETIKNDTVFGTTDKPITLSWSHEYSNQYHIEVRFIADPGNSTEVIYNIYDGDIVEPIYTTIIDQTDIEQSDKWILLGWYHPTSTGTIRIEVVNSSNNLCIDAIRLSKHHCKETLFLSNERDTNVGYTGVWETIDTGGYDDSYVISIGEATHAWTFDNLAVSNNKLSFDYYLYQVETKTSTIIKNTDKYMISESLPRSGHYLLYLRTKATFTEGYLDNYSRDGLIQKNILCRCGVDVSDQMNTEEIISLMYEAGKHSIWVNTSMEDRTLHSDCSKKSFWVYGYIAPPGPIVIK